MTTRSSDSWEDALLRQLDHANAEIDRLRGQLEHQASENGRQYDSMRRNKDAEIDRLTRELEESKRAWREFAAEDTKTFQDTAALRFDNAAYKADMDKIRQHMGDAAWEEMWRIIEGNYT